MQEKFVGLRIVFASFCESVSDTEALEISRLRASSLIGLKSEELALKELEPLSVVLVSPSEQGMEILDCTLDLLSCVGSLALNLTEKKTNRLMQSTSIMKSP